jgi:hypothetical protein
MKKGIIFLFIVCTATASAEAQSLKDLLYSGKLKKDTSKQEPEKPKPAAAPVTGQVEQGSNSNPVPATESVASAEPSGTNPSASKSNTKILKEYSDALVAALKTEVLSSKKVKKETYYFTVNYEIDITGAVSITNVTVSPENDFLLEQVKQRLSSAPPQLQPVLDNNQPKKVKRRYNFTVTKD